MTDPDKWYRILLYLAVYNKNCAFIKTIQHLCDILTSDVTNWLCSARLENSRTGLNKYSIVQVMLMKSVT